MKEVFVLIHQPQHTAEVPEDSMIFLGLMSGAFFGAFLKQQKRSGIPTWVLTPKRHNKGFHYVYVVVPNGSGFVTTLKHLMDKPMKDEAVDAAMKVKSGVAMAKLEHFQNISSTVNVDAEKT